MDKTLRAIAVRLSAMLFFIMALAGWLSGHEPVVCAHRALLGAVALYMVVRIAGNLVMKILLEAMAQDHIRRGRNEH